MPLNSESDCADLPRKKLFQRIGPLYLKLHLRKFVFGLGSARSVFKIPKIMVGATIVEFCKRLLDGDRLILRILYIRVAFTSERLVSRFSISNYHLQAHLPI